jgi:AAA ATPase domain
VAQLQSHLKKLGLTDNIQTQRFNETQLELRVGRVPGSSDTVNIADVGFGVSQVLPVIVALLVAEQGQIVYVEQPEIHLHPHAQVAMAEIFAEAINRGVQVIVETHSELFLLGIQTLVTEDTVAPDDVQNGIDISPALLRNGLVKWWVENFGRLFLFRRLIRKFGSRSKTWPKPTKSGQQWSKIFCC